MGMVSGGLFKPEWLTRDILVLHELLQFDEQQQDVVEMLLEDYDANFRMAVEETQLELEALGESSGVGALEQDRVEELRGRMESMREQMRAMREQQSSDEPAEMSEEERAAQQEKMQAVRAEFRDQMRTIRDEFREVRDSQMNSEEGVVMLQGQMDMLRRFERARRAMGEQVTTSIIGVLSERQIEAWPLVDRMIRRLRQLPEGRLQGERTDLGPIMDRFHPQLEETAAEAIRAIMDAWELDLDDALSRRMKGDANAIFVALEAMPKRDFDTLLELTDRRTRDRRVVRDVTDSAIEAIAATMQEPMATEFRKDALEEGYGRVFRPSRAQRAITSALELDGLDEELVAAIEALQAECDAAMGAHGELILEAVRRYEEPREVRFIRRMRDRELGTETPRGEDDDPIRAAYDRRGEDEGAFIERLRDLLGEELAAQVRELAQPQGDRGWQRQGDRGDREQMRAQFMERFDANGDGEIDDAERATIRETFRRMREEGGSQGGRGGPPPFGGG